MACLVAIPRNLPSSAAISYQATKIQRLNLFFGLTTFQDSIQKIYVV